MTKELDPITLQVVGGALHSIAEQMGNVLYRMSYSSIIRESQDPDLSKRHTINMAVKVTVDGAAKDVLMQALSKGGVAILDRGLGVREGSGFTIALPGLGDFEAMIVAKTEDNTHVRLDLDDGEAAKIASFIAERS